MGENKMTRIKEIENTQKKLTTKAYKNIDYETLLREGLNKVEFDLYFQLEDEKLAIIEK